MSDAVLKTEGVDISPEAVDALTERLWEYGTVIGKAPSTQDAVCHDAAHMVEALRAALTASEKDVEVWKANSRVLELQLTASEKDAERYRWLRGCSRDALEAMRPSLLWGAEHLDANIDAAMEKANG